MNRFAVLSVLLLSLPAHAVSSRVGSAQDLGIGLALGQPMGITTKYWMDSTTAIDAQAGYHFNSNFDIHADYLFHTFSSFEVSRGRLPFYAGVGARVLLGNSSQLGMRLPLGATYLLPTDPIEVYAEVAPVVRLVTRLGLDIDGVVGFRVYINYLK